MMMIVAYRNKSRYYTTIAGVLRFSVSSNNTKQNKASQAGASQTPLQLECNKRNAKPSSFSYTKTNPKKKNKHQIAQSNSFFFLSFSRSHPILRFPTYLIVTCLLTTSINQSQRYPATPILPLQTKKTTVPEPETCGSAAAVGKSLFYLNASLAAALVTLPLSSTIDYYTCSLVCTMMVVVLFFIIAVILTWDSCKMHVEGAGG
ncbi:unnamed protein product [Periconia digitata]|uniref:Uncharacterized protein n=1 Tax=Periconia digitata TaxID=1303443 RepID=A0A9W4XHG3_9PLEO|nr:unnamed protein product [Periconia digitata]